MLFRSDLAKKKLEETNGDMNQWADDQKAPLNEYLEEMKKLNKLIIITSHIKDDINELADEIYMFDDGNLKYVGNK